MAAYYNEIDKAAAEWLRGLIKAGVIADGEVDTRSIVDVRAGDVRGFDQCHFFAGIGGWSLALRLAGWPDDRSCWTGSCPCQPFSSAGKGDSTDDPRDLWPAWFQLLRECRPHVVFGEQVESAIAHGWLDRLCDDVEGEGYAVGACGLPAASVGAFHIRQRLWFVAESNSVQPEQPARPGARPDEAEGWRACGEPAGSGDAGRMADTEHAERRALRVHREDERDGHDARRAETHGQPGARREVRAVADADGRRLEVGPERHGQSQEHPADRHPCRADVDGCGDVGELADATGRGLGIDGGASGHAGHVDERESAGELGDAEKHRQQGRPLRADRDAPDGATEASFWADAEWIPCRDGKARPVKPGIFPLVDGVSGGRVALGRAVQSPAAALSEAEAAHEFSRTAVLRGAGNAISPQVAAAFIGAYLEVVEARS